MRLVLTHECKDTGPLVLDSVEARGVVYGRQDAAPELVRFRVSREDAKSLKPGMRGSIVAGVFVLEQPKPKAVRLPQAKKRAKHRAKRGE